ncbi:hypothetical protein ACPW96_21500 [Micromonospora sp. DT81.3]|uniref:hypothetical protein n=1 Tax=Micromonospora sp. DT81.3 TaxID=3416523 RepID=UPI003CE9FDEE
MTGQPHVSEDDWISMLLLLTLAVGTGIVSLGMFLDPLRAWMLQYHLLEQGDAVTLPLFDGFGFGLGQILVVISLLIAGIALIVWLKRRSAARI